MPIGNGLSSGFRTRTKLLDQLYYSLVLDSGSTFLNCEDIDDINTAQYCIGQHLFRTGPIVDWVDNTLTLNVLSVAHPNFLKFIIASRETETAPILGDLVDFNKAKPEFKNMLSYMIDHDIKFNNVIHAVSVTGSDEPLLIRLINPVLKAQTKWEFHDKSELVVPLVFKAPIINMKWPVDHIEEVKG